MRLVGVMLCVWLLLVPAMGFGWPIYLLVECFVGAPQKPLPPPPPPPRPDPELEAIHQDFKGRLEELAGRMENDPVLQREGTEEEIAQAMERRWEYADEHELLKVQFRLKVNECVRKRGIPRELTPTGEILEGRRARLAEKERFRAMVERALQTPE